ncbi:uncharacterized protein [Procambarus clarkii]|uniref:uncharacterized protein n=1 Tax=Procambarus clarkii TaxID=6728 RepID=UPI0037423966
MYVAMSEIVGSEGVVRSRFLTFLIGSFFSVVIGVVSGDYLSDFQVPAQNQLSLVADFNGGARRTPLTNGGYNTNGVTTGGFPGISGTRGAFGTNTGEGGGLKTSGTTLGGTFLPRVIGVGDAGFGGNRQTLEFDGRDPIAELQEALGGVGVPDEDYPILFSVPNTEFSCDGLLPGYYADTSEQARCQVFHICQDKGKISSFLCPNGTIFNQQYFVCDWWYNFDCSTAQQFYGLNAQIGQDISSVNSFGSASSSQDSFSFLGNGNVNNASPSTENQVSQVSASNQQGSFSDLTAGAGSNGFTASTHQISSEKFASATDQRTSSIFALTVGDGNKDVPSVYYGIPSSNKGNSDSRFIQKPLQKGGSTRAPNGGISTGFTGSNVQTPFDKFSSATHQQGSFSAPTFGAGNNDRPSPYYGTPGSIKVNFGTSTNEKPAPRRGNTRITNVSTTSGLPGTNTLAPSDRFGSATAQHGSFSAFSVGVRNPNAPSSKDGNTSVGNGQFEASTNQKVVSRKDNIRAGDSSRNREFIRINNQVPSGLYQAPGQ